MKKFLARHVLLPVIRPIAKGLHRYSHSLGAGKDYPCSTCRVFPHRAKEVA